MWLQNIDEVGLTQITDQPALATQGHEINQVACDNPDCKAETSNVYYTADFSPSYVTNPEEIIKKGNMGVFQYLHEHFSSEEIKRLIAEMMGDDSLSENLSFSDVQGAARELILHYGRRGSNLSLAAHIVKFRFESNLSGHSIAVQCQYCGRVASTRINNEGMILIDYCNSCANIDKWQVYRTPVQNETELTDNQGKKYVPYDMYGSYIRKANEEGVLPTMLHQTVLQSTALNS